MQVVRYRVDADCPLFSFVPEGYLATEVAGTYFALPFSSSYPFFSESFVFIVEIGQYSLVSYSPARSMS